MSCVCVVVANGVGMGVGIIGSAIMSNKGISLRGRCEFL